MRLSNEEEKVAHFIARKALGHWGLADSRCSLHSARENVVFRVTSSSGEQFALRIHRSGYHDFSALESEHAWTKALSEAGLGVLEPISTRDGQGYAKIELPESAGVRYAGLVRWVESRPLYDYVRHSDDRASTMAYFSRVGGLAAKFHDQAVRWRQPANFRRHAWDAPGLMGAEPFWGRFWETELLSREARSTLTELRQTVLGELNLLSKSSGYYSLIHADFNGQNILVDGEKLLVIDFDDAGFGWHVFDLAVALYDFQRSRKSGRLGFEDFRDALLDGYLRERNLPSEEIARLPLFLLSRSMTIIGWIDGRPERSTKEDAEFIFRRVIKQAEGLGYL